MIYLDNAATTRVLPQGVDAAVAAMTQCYGNPAAEHGFGKTARDIVEGARASVLRGLGATHGTLAFTSGGTESINWAITFAAQKNKHLGRHIVTTAVEHAATLETVKALVAQGYTATYVQPEGDGSVSPLKIIQAIQADTTVLSVMAVCNETGAVLPFEQVAAAAKQINPSIITHLDAVQGYLKVPLPLKGWDLVSISAHKIGGVKGCGGLYAAPQIKLTPMFYGGYQEAGLRSGTQAVPQIAAFGCCASYGLEHFEAHTKHMAELRTYLCAGLSGLPFKAHIVQPLVVAPHIVNVGFLKGRSEVLIRVLSDRGIAVSGGSACAGGKKSHVLMAMKIRPEVVNASLRISLCPENTKKEIDILLVELTQAMGMFR